MKELSLEQVGKRLRRIRSQMELTREQFAEQVGISPQFLAEIENGRGIAVRNSNGGTYCQKNSYICDAQVSVNVNDLDMFRLFAKTEAWIRAFEQEYAFRSYLLNLFNKLYLLIKKEISGQTEVIIRHIDQADEWEDDSKSRKAS